jgi:hypothetical protein
MLNHKVTSKRRKSRNPLIASLSGQNRIKNNANSLFLPSLNPTPQLSLFATKAIENQRIFSLRSSVSGHKIGVATGTKIEGRFKHFPPSKVKKNEN